MKDLFCLSAQAIQALKMPGVKCKIMYALEVNDTRTIDKHMRNNFPNSPLMNFNVREIIKEVLPELDDKAIYRKLTREEAAKVREKRKEMQKRNSKYNNIKKQDT